MLGMMLGTGTIVINKIDEVFALRVKETDNKQFLITAACVCITAQSHYF